MKCEPKRTAGEEGIGSSTEPCGTPGSHFVEPVMGSEIWVFHSLAQLNLI